MSQPPKGPELLPINSLAGTSLGISVSESEDLRRLGLSENHFRLALAEIARTILVSGGDIYYGGHLHPGGYTVFLLEELQKYGRRDQPLKICLNWVEHQSISDDEIGAMQSLIGMFGEVLFLDVDGDIIKRGRPAPTGAGNFSDVDSARALTGLRQFLVTRTDARILLGGKRRDFQGSIPGIVEEAVLSIQERKPIFLAGGFGGATLDIVNALHPEFAAWFPGPIEQPDARLNEGLSSLVNKVKKFDWDGSKNGLTDDENALLAATYRPSEVAALIGLGLGRLQGI